MEIRQNSRFRILVFIFALIVGLVIVSVVRAAGVATLVADIYPGSTDSSVDFFTVYDGELYFRADGNDGAGLELWKYNRTTDTVSRVADIFPGLTGSNPVYFAVYDGALYFRANGNDGFGNELWKYDSATDTASRVADIRTGPASSNPYYPTVFNGELYFRARGDTGGEELWKYNSTTGTASLAYDIYAGNSSSQPSYLAVYNGELYFRANGNDGSGEELWKYDGSNPPTLVADIRSGVVSSTILDLTVYNGALYFGANGGDGSGQELWKYDGVNPPSLAADINPTSSSNPDGLVVYNGELYFGAFTGGGVGNELWKFSSSTATAELVLDINPVGSSSPTGLAVYGDEIYFQVDGGDGSGAELWKYYLDAAAPLVVSTDLASIYTTGPFSFVVTFNEDVNDPAGNTDVDDVTNPANYLLVEAGANAVFDTGSCAGGLAPDDTQVTVDSVIYAAGTFEAAVSLNGGAALPDGSYRLFVCGTTSIMDLEGNPLAGDGTNPGTDYVFDFSVQAEAPAPEPLPTALPETGFPPGTSTVLPKQPSAARYAATDLVLEIPSIGVQMQIVGVPQSSGTWDVTWLGNNAGYLYGSAFPTWVGNTVLTGHVWDANNKPGPFAELKSLRYGDLIEIHAWGLVYTYEVRQSRLLWSGQVNTVFEHQEYDWLTLLTCEFYSPLSGDYLFRRAVQAVLVGIAPE